MSKQEITKKDINNIHDFDYELCHSFYDIKNMTLPEIMVPLFDKKIDLLMKQILIDNIEKLNKIYRLYLSNDKIDFIKLIHKTILDKLIIYFRVKGFFDEIIFNFKTYNEMKNDIITYENIDITINKGFVELKKEFFEFIKFFNAKETKKRWYGKINSLILKNR